VLQVNCKIIEHQLQEDSSGRMPGDIPGDI